jgi:hypothetical protein
MSSRHTPQREKGGSRKARQLRGVDDGRAGKGWLRRAFSVVVLVGLLRFVTVELLPPFVYLAVRLSGS